MGCHLTIVLQLAVAFLSLQNSIVLAIPTQLTNDHGLNMELDLQSLFGLLCTAIIFG